MTTVRSIASTQENRLKAFMKHNPLLSMYVILFVLGWSFLVPQVLYSQRVLSAQPPMVLGLLAGWAPGIAAVIVTAVIAGRAGVRELLGRFLIWRVGFQWYSIAVFALAAFILGGIGLQVMFGGATPVIPAAGASVFNIVLSLVILIVAGILLNTEEIAWRGFALPRLQAKYGVLMACILLAIPEALLHLPYFWDKDIAFYQNVGIFWFTAFSVAAVFIYAYIFNKTNGSLIQVTIMHASQNAWANLLSDNTTRPFQFTVALMWMVALALIFLTKGQLGYETEGK